MLQSIELAGKAKLVDKFLESTRPVRQRQSILQSEPRAYSSRQRIQSSQRARENTNIVTNLALINANFVPKNYTENSNNLDLISIGMNFVSQFVSIDTNYFNQIFIQVLLANIANTHNILNIYI